MNYENEQKCLLCGSIKQKIVLSNVYDTRFGIEAPYNILCCPSCGLEQTSPIPDNDDLKILYEKYYNFSEEKNSSYVNIRDEILSSFIYKLWMRLDGDISFYLVKGSGRLLDIGCNEGRGLNIYSKNGFHAEGIELNEVAAQSARDKGFTVHTNLLEDFSPPGLYDVIVLSNVLEHSLNPRDMLVKVHTLLSPNGKVWISCPNSNSVFRNIFGAYWINWHVPFHVVHFSSSTINKILLETGFKNIRLSMKSPSAWIAYSVISRFFFNSGSPTKELQNPILLSILMLMIKPILFPILFLFNILSVGDCIVVEANKS